MIYLDEKKQKIETKDVWKYEFVSNENNEVVHLKTASEGYLRHLREIYCFAIVNRGELWYDTLTNDQIAELNVWYRDWLNVTDTKVIPDKPSWLK